MAGFKPEISIGMGLALVTIVHAINQNATPNVADIRTLPEGNEDIEKAQKSAAWMAAGIVGVTSLIAKDPVIFWFGGLAVIGEAWWTKHANGVNPDLKRYVPGGAVQSEPVAQMETEDYTAFENQFTGSAFAAG